MSPQLRRTVLDFAPLLLFFAAYRVFNLTVATATVMVAASAAVGIGFWIDRKISPVPLATAVIVLVFGGLTLYFKNDAFIKMKPTIYYAMVSALLLGGLLFNRHLVKYVLGPLATLNDAHWRVLSWRFGLFFLVMAILNELIWRNFSSDVWVNYHVFGAWALTVLFSLSQTPFLLKHNRDDEPGPNP